MFVISKVLTSNRWPFDLYTPIKYLLNFKISLILGKYTDFFYLFYAQVIFLSIDEYNFDYNL